MANRAGFNPDDKISKTSKSYEAALAGLMSGVITRSIVQPMDVFKIRYQLQIESKSSAKYQNLRQSFGSILKEEGVAAFWKGGIYKPRGQRLKLAKNGPKSTMKLTEINRKFAKKIT